MSRQPKGRGIFVAKETTVVDYEGAPVTLVKDVTRIREGHPILKNRSEMFKPLSEHVDYEVDEPKHAATETRG